jgi:hypothetical protein
VQRHLPHVPRRNKEREILGYLTVASSPIRLATLCGSERMGKTRLAIVCALF